METDTMPSLAHSQTKRGDFKVYIDEDYEEPKFEGMLNTYTYASKDTHDSQFDIAYESKGSFNNIGSMKGWYQNVSINGLDVISYCDNIHSNIIFRGNVYNRNDHEVYPSCFTKIVGEIIPETHTKTSAIIKEINDKPIYKNEYSADIVTTTLPENIVKKITEEIENAKVLGFEVEDYILKKKLYGYVEDINNLNPADLFICVTSSFSLDIHVVLNKETSLSLKKPLNNLPELEVEDFIFSLLISGSSVLTAVAPLSEIIEGARRIIAE